MKKLLFMALIGIGGAVFLKGGYLTVTPDNQVHVASWTVPLPADVQNSPILGMVATMAGLRTASQPNIGDPRYGATQPARPALPNVTSATSIYNPNPPAAAPTQVTDQFNAVAKALRGQ
jgi:hypothetical protein